MDAFSKRRRIEADGGEIRVSEPSRRSERAEEEEEEEEEESAAAPAELESCCSVSEAGENGRAGEPSSFDQSIASSCCSSSVSEVETKCVDLEGESVIVVDDEDEDEASSERDRRGSMRREAGGEMKMSKTIGPAEGKRSYLQGGSAAGMPSELELEEFFAAGEKQIQQRFIQKYNYDVVNDVPLSGGRFEWV